MSSKKKPKKLSPRTLALQKREKADAALREAAQAARVESLKWVERLKADPDCIGVLQQKLIVDLQRVYNTPHKLLGRTAGQQRYRELGHYSETLVRMAFGTHTNFRAEAGLALTPTERKGASRAAALHQEQKVRRYYEKEIAPFTIDPFQKFNRTGRLSFVFASDHHAKKLDPFAMRVYLDFLAWANPDLVVHGGDVVEFSDFSTHRKFPGHFDLEAPEEVEYVRENIFCPAREAAPSARHIMLLGNHEYRLVRYVADRASELSGMHGMNLVDQLGLRDLEIGLVCRSNFLAPTSKMRRIDVAENWMVVEDLMLFTHGQYTGPNANNAHYKRFQMSGCNGHEHGPSQSFYNSLSGGPCTWVTAPMMAGLAVGRDYVSLPNHWQSGFVYGTIDKRSGEVQQTIITVRDSASFANRVWRINAKERRLRQEAWEVR